jgi:hypothetical protein
MIPQYSVMGQIYVSVRWAARLWETEHIGFNNLTL